MKTEPTLNVPLASLPPVARDHILSLSLRDNCSPVQTMVNLLKTAAQRRLAPEQAASVSTLVAAGSTFVVGGAQ